VKPLLTEIAAIDAVLGAHTVALGADFTAYRNHVYRVANLCVAQTTGSGDQVEKIAIAAVCHDLGIWTDRTFDYLAPSVELARAHLATLGKAEWIAEITEMILQHHKLTPYRGNPSSLIEPFRRADWIDVSKGLRTFGLPRAVIRAVSSTWPSAGFHWRLVQLEMQRLRTHPWSPLPMVRL
jgi:HD domain-containing protein